MMVPRIDSLGEKYVQNRIGSGFFSLWEAIGQGSWTVGMQPSGLLSGSFLVKDWGFFVVVFFVGLFEGLVSRRKIVEMRKKSLQITGYVMLSYEGPQVEEVACFK